MRAPSGDKASDSKVCMPAADGWTGCAATAASAVGAAPAAPAAASAATASAAAVSAVSAAAAVIRIAGERARIGTSPELILAAVLRLGGLAARGFGLPSDMLGLGHKRG